MEDQDLVLLFYYLCVNNYILQLLNAEPKPRKRRWWMIKLHRNRTRASMEILFSELLSETSSQFFNFFRMSASDFEYLLNKIGPCIAKQDTKFRQSIPPKIRLAVTLRYLATGDSFRSLHYLFKISHQQISDIVSEVCEAITVYLKDVVKLPEKPEEWLKVEKGFNDVYPHCIGALDGKHVVIISPEHSGTEYFNYKHTFSIVLMALVDRNFCFLFCDIGCQGRISDGGVFKNCLLFKKLNDNRLNLPTPSPLPDRNINVPYVFVADNAFPLQHNIMKPFPGDCIEGSFQRTFNINLSRARIVVENAFGIMSGIFRVLRKPIHLQPEKAARIVMSCVLLHNFLRKSKTSTNIYCPPGYADSFKDGEIISGTWRNEQQVNTALRSMPMVARRSAGTPLEIRKEFAEYFVNRRTQTQ